MPDQNKDINKGGTLRLGSYPCQIVPGTKMAECYGKEQIDERHRHRYEFNKDYRETVEQSGMKISGTSPGVWWRRWSCRRSAFLWRASSTRSLSPGPTGPTRSLRASSARQWTMPGKRLDKCRPFRYTVTI